MSAAAAAVIPWQARLREIAVPALAGAAVMIASLVNFLNHNEYPVFRPEIGLVVALLLAVVLAMGLLYAVSGRLVRMGLQILFVYVALDLNFDGIFVAIATVAIAITLQGRAIPFVGIAACVVLVTTLAGMAVAERSTKETLRGTLAEHRGDLPVLVHLILDEHIGIEGFPDSPSDFAEMHEAMRRFYLDKNFRLFGAAYSEHIHTQNSIPQILNFGVERPWRASDRKHSTLRSNAYFDRLGALGYRIVVSQTDYLNYCDHEFVVRCDTRRAAELAATANSSLSTAEKTMIVAHEFAKLSAMLYAPVIAYRMIAHRSQVLEIPPVGPLTTLDDLVTQLRSAKPGSAFFVHELLPHTPYALDPNCVLRPLTEWRGSGHGQMDERMKAYFDQITCVNGKIEAVLKAAGSNAIVVIHGDHGSRIAATDPNVENIGRFTDDELIAGYSTIFAIRAPGIDGGYDRRPLPVAEILRQIAESGFRSAQVSVAPDFVPSVVLENLDWKPVQRQPLPAGWPAAPATH